MKKKISLFLISILSFICVSCNPSISNESSTPDIEYSKDLIFKLNNDGKSYYTYCQYTEDTIINVPATYKGLPVTRVTSFPTHIEEINLPNTITTISGIGYNKLLKSINIPSSVETIDNFAFAFCTSLTKIDLPKNIKKIGRFAFAECTSLESITIPEGVKYIDDSAFSDCISLKELTIPNSLQFMGYSTINLEITNYSDGGYYIGNKDNPYLSLVSIDEGLTELTVKDGCRFFNLNSESDTSKLEKINFPQTMEILHCANSAIPLSSLVEVNGECKIKHIREDSFEGAKLTTFPTLKYCKFIGSYAFRGCRLLGTIDLSSIETLSEYAFSNCKNITEIILGENLKAIERNTFEKCSALETIYISKNLKNISDNAFLNCSNIQNIYYEGDEEEWDRVDIIKSNVSFISNAKVHYNSFNKKED